MTRVSEPGLRPYLRPLLRRAAWWCLRVTVTITWDIAWHGTGGGAGALPPLGTTAAVAMRVAESQAVNTAGGQ